MNKDILIIGTGNQYRSDDGIGLYIAEKIQEKNISDVTVKKTSGEGTTLIDLWKESSHVIVIDAVSSDAQPGTLHYFNANKDVIPSQMFNCSSHSFGLGEAIKLSQALGKLPDNLILFGIEGKTFEAGETFSKEIKEEIKNTIEAIEKEINVLKREKTNA